MVLRILIKLVSLAELARRRLFDVLITEIGLIALELRVVIELILIYSLVLDLVWIYSLVLELIRIYILVLELVRIYSLVLELILEFGLVLRLILELARISLRIHFIFVASRMSLACEVLRIPSILDTLVIWHTELTRAEVVLMETVGWGAMKLIDLLPFIELHHVHS